MNEDNDEYNRKELVSVIFSEFDNVVGPKIVFQVPDNQLSKDQYDSISDYIITDEEGLCNRTVTVTSNGYTIMGYPLKLEDKKYGRNKYLFNIALVFAEENGEEIPRYRSSLEKLAKTLFELGKLWFFTSM